MIFKAPVSALRSFTCPHCGVVARQYHWGYNMESPDRFLDEDRLQYSQLRVSKCEHCTQVCVWWKDKMILPSRGAAPPPHSDMPNDVRADYDEAAQIYTASSRGAAALLRLALQKLMVALGQSGKNINSDIGSLVKGGLPVTIQEALDIVRVTGNNAVHPGQIDVDDPRVSEQLFALLNVIVESQIAVPKRVKELYEALPETNKVAIKNRDGR